MLSIIKIELLYGSKVHSGNKDEQIPYVVGVECIYIYMKYSSRFSSLYSTTTTKKVIIGVERKIKIKIYSFICKEVYKQ